ncbi:DUF3467 domain-containing protein [Tenuifilum thalassicum]|uniref:DUF3467 domain-containing protein n=1 Tax=Tenuifilum thalassicum TaxID=2590900 RepID=A0A7D4C8G9_9BACT|nr:DUF3467 domain-containing protein [Tenuifilum thalassicum]QKG79542.1 DUF3467 domain-containing protein [Tenuifilum thalassicum]
MSEKQNPINIELNDEVAQGTYSNLAVITHSSSEFIIDFVRIMPGMPKAQVKSRIIMTPDHAKRLLFALQDNLAKYEANMGPIKLPEGNEGMPPFPMNFGTKGGEA